MVEHAGLGNIVILPVDAAVMEATTSLTPGAKAWFLGSDWGKRTAIEARWTGGFGFSPIAVRANAIAWRIVDQIINIDAQIVPLHQRAWWLASDVGDRGPYVSSLFEKTSWYLAFLELLAEGGDHVFVVEDVDFARVLYVEALKRGHRTGWIRSGHRKPVREVIRRAAVRLRRRIKLVASRAIRTWHGIAQLNHVHRLRRSAPIRIADLKNADIILVGWAEPGGFSPHTKIETIYGMGTLPAMLRRAGLNIGLLALPIDWLHDYRALAGEIVHAADPTLLLEDCIGAGTIAGAAVGTARLRARVNSRVMVSGQDVSAVADLALEEELTKWRPARSKLFESVGPALARMGIAPRAIVYPHEGQPWEKSLARGVHAALPQTRMVAYQCAPFAPLHISFFPSAEDVARGDAPDHILLSGEEYVDWFSRHGFPPTRLSNAGALRRPVVAERRISNVSPKMLRVVCSCSILASESWELIEKSAAAIRELAGMVLVVNFHPLTPQADRDATADWVGGLPHYDAQKIQFSDAPFAKLALEADIVVCDRSGVVFEAMALGIPVVNVCSDSTLELNKVRANGIPACRTIDEIRYAFQTCRNQKGTDLAIIMSRYLGAVRTDVIISALT